MERLFWIKGVNVWGLVLISQCFLKWGFILYLLQTQMNLGLLCLLRHLPDRSKEHETNENGKNTKARTQQEGARRLGRRYEALSIDLRKGSVSGGRRGRREWGKSTEASLFLCDSERRNGEGRIGLTEATRAKTAVQARLRQSLVDRSRRKSVREGGQKRIR